jgi:HSP20 family molecular chaperone IbpA
VYVRKKKLEVNVEKTKMIVLNNRKKKNEENEWKWARKQDRKCERV